MPFVEVPKYTEFDDLRTNKTFRVLMDTAIELKIEIEALEAELAEVKEDIEVELAAAAVDGSVDYMGYRVCVVDKVGSPRLDRKKLLKLLGPKGVEIMQKATVIGKPSHYVSLTSPKQEEEKNGDS